MGIHTTAPTYRLVRLAGYASEPEKVHTAPAAGCRAPSRPAPPHRQRACGCRRLYRLSCPFSSLKTRCGAIAEDLRGPSAGERMVAERAGCQRRTRCGAFAEGVRSSSAGQVPEHL
eukprot:365194-Chlamydomonas_euryale.AAC.2